MSRSTAPFVRLVVSAVLISVFSVMGSAQIALREALDFDGDGKSDFAVFRKETATWFINGTTGLFIAQQWGIAAEDRLVPGDYDGDNIGDIAVWRDATGDWHVLNSHTFTYSGTQWGTNGDNPVARDYDGDGKTDPAIVRSLGGALYWMVHKSSGGSFVFQWGASTDYVVPGDFDGDGLFDFAVQRGDRAPNSPSIFFVWGSSVGFLAVPWGFTSDLVVPGDYDGDGKTDIAVVRQGTTKNDPVFWYALRSDGLGYIVEQFGATGDDYPVQGDYDGDHTTDIAVWRQSTGTFLVLNRNNHTIYGGQWGGVGDLPVASYDSH